MPAFLDTLKAWRRLALGVLRGLRPVPPVPDPGVAQRLHVPLGRASVQLLLRGDAAARTLFVNLHENEQTSVRAALRVLQGRDERLLRLQAQGLQRARDDETRRLALDRLLAGIDRATRLVEQLLMLARQEAGTATGSLPQPVQLRDLVRASVAEVHAQATIKHIDLGLGAADEGQLTGQPEALRILLRNLLDNALKYTPEHGQVDVSLRRQGAFLMLAVEDSGPGIAEAERSRVVDRFYRVQGAAAGGSGLGLAIVNAIARSHGTKLMLDRSEALGGLRVELHFPLAT